MVWVWDPDEAVPCWLSWVCGLEPLLVDWGPLIVASNLCDGVLRRERLFDREDRSWLQAFRCFSLGSVLVERCVSKQIAHVRARRGNALRKGQCRGSFAVNEGNVLKAQVLSSSFLRS